MWFSLVTKKKGIHYQYMIGDMPRKKLFTNFLFDAGTPSSATMVEWYRTSGSTPVSLQKQYRVSSYSGGQKKLLFCISDTGTVQAYNDVGCCVPNLPGWGCHEFNTTQQNMGAGTWGEADRLDR